MIIKQLTGARQLLALALLSAICLTGQATTSDLLRLVDRLDQIDKQDFQALIERANGCTRSRDFACADQQLTKATGLATDKKDKETLAVAVRTLGAEKSEVAREKAEAERREAQRLAEIEREEARREKQARNDERREACENRCSAGPDMNVCMRGLIEPHNCRSGDDSNGTANRGNAFAQQAAKNLADYGAIAGIHNNMVRNLQAQQAERQNREQQQREQQRDQQQRAEAERRADQQQHADAARRDRDADAQAARRESQAAERVQRAQREQQEQQAQQRRDQEQQQQRVALAQQAGSSGTQRVAASGNADNNTGSKVRKAGMTQDDGPCISYGATIPVGKSVCYADSMEQWRCVGSYGKSVFRKVQKIIMKSEIKVDNVCSHVDRANLRPARELQLE